MIPAAVLRVEAYMTNPPTPIGFHAVDVLTDLPFAVLSYTDVRRAVDQYEAMLDIRNKKAKNLQEN